MCNIPVIKVPTDAQAVLSSTSKGDSMKWYLQERNIFVKANRVDHGVEYQDSITEVLASRIATQLYISCVPYSLCYIDTNDQPLMLGTVSPNFCDQDESYLSFETMVESSYEKLSWGVSAQENYDLTLRLFGDLTGLDARCYLDSMLLFDYLICNEDRHTNNFGVLYNAETQQYRFPPLFDNGYSFGIMQSEQKPVQQFLYSCKAKPFSTSFDKQLRLITSLPEGIVLPSSFRSSLFDNLPVSDAMKERVSNILLDRLSRIKEKF